MTAEPASYVTLSVRRKVIMLMFFKRKKMKGKKVDFFQTTFGIAHRSYLPEEWRRPHG
jgi:hypothetical protein